jgi:TPP-dependent pyruvate/acetoin dehydrogenase alpha subunit
MAPDPIQKMETYLTRKGLFSEEMKLEVAAAFTKELDAAIEAAEASPFLEGVEAAAKISGR